MNKSIDYYLAMGMTHQMAKYFASGRRRITGVSPNSDFTLSITFDNGEIRVLDMKPSLMPGTVFEPFLDLDNFLRVYLDNNNVISWDIDPTIDSNVVWRNKVDLCPDTCYVKSVPIGLSDAEHG